MEGIEVGADWFERRLAVRFLRSARRLGLLLATAALALQSYLLLTYSEDFRSRAQRPLHRFQGMVRGDAPRPFVARALVPFVVRELGEKIPKERSESFLSPLKRLGFHVPRNVSVHGRRSIDPRHYAIWVYLAVGSLALLGEGIYRVLRHHYVGASGLFEAAAAGSLLLWPTLIAYGSFMIDAFTPTIVVWTLYAAIRFRWIAYSVLLSIAAFHKETMVAIPLAVGYLFYDRWPRRRTMTIVGLQVVGVVAVRAYLSFVVFGANPGSFIQFHLLGHNASLNVWRGFLPQMVLILVLVAGLVLRDFAEKPRGCKALAITVLPLLGMGVFSGYFDEIRQYAEGYPGLVCLAFPTLVNSFRSGLVRLRTEATV